MTSGSVLGDRICSSVSWSVTCGMRSDSSRMRPGLVAQGPVGCGAAHRPAGNLPAGTRWVAVTQVSGRGRSRASARPSDRPRGVPSGVPSLSRGSSLVTHSLPPTRPSSLSPPAPPPRLCLAHLVHEPTLTQRALERAAAASPRAWHPGGTLTVLGFLVCRMRWLALGLNSASVSKNEVTCIKLMLGPQ